MAQKRIFAIGAHPDDIEFHMAGTLLLLKDAGWEAHYMTIGNGAHGSARNDAATTMRVRREEGMNAASLMGAVYHESFVNDLNIFFEKGLLARVSAVVREVAPEILLIHPPDDYMEDHVNACRLAVTAAFTRGISSFPTDPPTPAVNNEVTLYHCQPCGNKDQLNRSVHPDFFVNIGDVIKEKTAMLAEHKSQKEWLDESQGLDSYLDTMQAWGRDMGKLSGGCEFAEGWRHHNPAGFCAEGSDPIADVLGKYVINS